MIQFCVALIVGIVAGIVFALFKLPVPAPATFTGVAGVVGLTIGYIIIKHFTA